MQKLNRQGLVRDHRSHGEVPVTVTAGVLREKGNVSTKDGKGVERKQRQLGWTTHLSFNHSSLFQDLLHDLFLLVRPELVLEFRIGCAV